MAEYVKELYSWIAFVPNMTFKNFLEIGIIAFVVYEVLVWIKNTRAWTLLKGILFICGFVLMAAVLELDTILQVVDFPECGGSRHHRAGHHLPAGAQKGAGAAGEQERADWNFHG